jgi:hypothetical protein
MDLARIVHNWFPEAGQATASVGGSYRRWETSVKDAQIKGLWRALHPGAHPPPPPPPPPTPPPPEQFGPFNWNPIVFGGGVAVGGSAQLTLFRDGAVNFTGHFHDSGGLSYDMTCVFAVRANDGTVYTFSRTGRVHGTFEAGSRDFDWGDNPTQTAVAAGWGNLTAGLSWHANAGANGDVGQLVDQAVKAVGQAAAVVAIIA